MKKKRFYLIRLFDILAILSFVVTFSPLVIPHHEINPSFMHIPYTMWMGFVMSIFFVILTYLVSLTNKEENNAK